MNAVTTLSVGQLNEYVRRSLASDPMLRGLCLRGELSNFKRHVSGHWYFTLKDSEGAIQCAMFRQSAVGVRFAPRDGQQVRLFGSVGLYAKTGQYQFYAEAMEQDGLGELYLRFEQLKQRLTEEGLFDPALKKPLPLFPRGIGVITSKTGAVVHDIARIAWRRDETMPLYLFPVAVQGTDAPAEIARALCVMDRLDAVEVLIVGRGGGSMEDLWAFNEEIVARAIALCRKPVVSAVGHETDFTIADFVADVRAATPSAAAELAVPQREAVKAVVAGLEERLSRSAEQGLNRRELALAQVLRRLTQNAPERRLDMLHSRAQQAALRIQAAVENAMKAKENAAAALALRLRMAGPEATLARGYALVLREGKPVQKISNVKRQEELRVLLQDGALTVTVNGIAKEGEPWRQKQ